MWRSAWADGRAMFTMVESSTTISWAIAMKISAVQRLGSGWRVSGITGLTKWMRSDRTWGRLSAVPAVNGIRDRCPGSCRRKEGRAVVSDVGCRCFVVHGSRFGLPIPVPAAVLIADVGCGPGGFRRGSGRSRQRYNPTGCRCELFNAAFQISEGGRGPLELGTRRGAQPVEEELEVTVDEAVEVRTGGARQWPGELRQRDHQVPDGDVVAHQALALAAGHDRVDRPFQVLGLGGDRRVRLRERKSTRLNSSHANISYAVFCLK